MDITRYQDEYLTSDITEEYYRSKSFVLDQKDVQTVIDMLGEVKNSDRKFGTLLDVGCGYGVTTSLMAKYFDHAIGVDASANQVKKAREINRCHHVEFKTGTAESLPVADNSIEVITAVFAVHYFDLALFVKECRRALKPEGVAILYSDFLSTFKSVEDDSLPPIVDEIKEMKKGCTAIAGASSHPAFRLLRGLQDVFDVMDWPKKELFQRKAEVEIDLASMRDHYLSVPLYAKLGTTAENPVILAYEKVMKRWKMEGVEMKDIKVRASFDASIIVLRNT